MRTVFVLAALIAAAFGQDQSLSKEETLAPVRKVFQLTREWEQHTSPGMKAELTLSKKIEHNGRLIFIYDLKISGADQDQKYALLEWLITDDKPSLKTTGLRVDDDGSVFCPANATDSCTKDYSGAILQLVFLPAKGELFRSAIISEDKKIGVFFSVVPDPIIAKDGACSIELVRLTRNFEMAVVTGKGFAPGDHLVFHAQSSGEIHDSETEADPMGAVYAELLPFIKGKKSGRTELTVRGSSCNPKLTFNWGKQD